MVTRYDIFYIIASNNGIGVPQILEYLNRSKKEYQVIFNHILSLEEGGLIKRDSVITSVQNDRAVLLFRIIDFCISNRINYNILLKRTMLDFIEKVSKIEFFTMKDVDINPRTFTFNITTLSRFGLLLIISNKPYRCKLLRHGILSKLFEFHGRELEFYEPTRSSFINEIIKEMKVYRKNLKIEYTVLDDIRKRQEVEFIYSSLHLEGNPITLPQTQRLIHEGVYPQEQKMVHINEISNYKKAVDKMLMDVDQKNDLTLQRILEYHELAMAHIHGGGEIRQQNVKIQGNPKFKTSEWRMIPKHIMDLMERYQKFTSSKRSVEDVIRFSAFFHNEFQRIHPFIDGNSRISRLLMMFILRSNDIPVLDLPLGYYDIYLDLTKRSEERDDDAFASIVEEMVFFSLKRMNGR